VKTIAVLISGRGSNLQALIDAAHSGTLGGTVGLVISNRPEVEGLKRAARAGIQSFTIDDRGRTREAHEAEIVSRIEEAGAELVCLAGYMRLVSGALLGAFKGRILNIHPSLLPAFPGLHAQRQALEYGVAVSGATVHFVTEGLDSGPILLQAAVPVAPDDSEATLSARIREVEHRIYPHAVSLALNKRYRIEGRRVVLEGV
jgi:phosphoribosylglycinamide formyltransferase-1